MLDLEEINNTIEELENAPTTYDTCIKLASLYIVKDNAESRLNSIVERQNVHYNNVESELSDILPQYRMYCEVKRQYALNQLTKEAVLLSMQDVCREIKEFMQTLYANTEMQEERTLLKEMLNTLAFD